MSNISDRFKAYREAAGLTQAELGALLSVKGNYVYQIEAGRKPPSDSLVKLFETHERAILTKSDRALAGRLREEGGSLSTSAGAHKAMPPPHVLPRSARPVPDSEKSHAEYAEAVTKIGQLFEHDPEAFKAALMNIRGLFEMVKANLKP